ncbi:unnamed protein product, partial [Ectocarpus sp. 4 AP-2014]
TCTRRAHPPPEKHAQISGSRYGSCPDFRRAFRNDNEDDTTVATKPLPGAGTDLHPSDARTNSFLPQAMVPSPSPRSPCDKTQASTLSLAAKGSAAAVAAAAAAADRTASASIDDNKVAGPTPPSASSSSSCSFSFGDTATGGPSGGVEPLEMDDDRAGSTPTQAPLPSSGGATTSSLSSSSEADAGSRREARNGGRIVRRGSRVGRGRRPHSLQSDDDDDQQQNLWGRSVSRTISSCSSGRSSSLRLVGSLTAGGYQSTGGGGGGPASPLGQAPRPPAPSHPSERRNEDDDGQHRRWRPAARQNPLLVRWSEPRLELIDHRPGDNSNNNNNNYNNNNSSCCRDSACDSGGRWACPSSGGGGGGSVSTASYVDEEEEEDCSAHQGIPSPSSDGHDDIDRYLSLRGVSPTSRPESADDRSSALRKRDGVFSPRFDAVGGGVVNVLPQEKAMLPPSGKHSRRDLQVLNLVDVNTGRRAVHNGTAAAGDAGAGASKRTPEERAYLRLAGLDDFSSTASSVGSCPLVHATAASRLAAAVKATATATAAAAENTGSMPGLVTPTSPAAGSLTSFDTTGGGLPPPAFEPLPARRAAVLSPPKDNVSFLYSWPSLPDSAPVEETFRAAGATPAAAANNNGGVCSHVGDDYGSGAVAGGEKGDTAPGKGGWGRSGEEVVLSPSADDASERSGSNRPNRSNFGSDDSYSGSDRSVSGDKSEEGGWVGGGGRRGGSGKIEPSSMFPRREGGIWIDVDGTPMGEILPAPRTSVASSLLRLDSLSGDPDHHHPRHPRSGKGLYPGKKPTTEAGGLGGFLEGVSAAAAAAASSRAWASDALWALVSCVGGEEEGRQEEMMSSPSILPYPGYMRPEEEEELSVWGGRTSTE